MRSRAAPIASGSTRIAVGEGRIANTAPPRTTYAPARESTRARSVATAYDAQPAAKAR